MDEIDRRLENEPWRMTDQASQNRRYDNRYHPRVEKLNRLVDIFKEEIKEETGTNVEIPWVDPYCGGVNARVLLILKDPGPAGAAATGFLSLGNTDGSAINESVAVREAGLQRTELMFWNVAPWCRPMNKPVSVPDLQRSCSMLERLLPLLPRLRVVILLGGEAHKISTFMRARGAYSVLECPHTARRAWNNPILRAKTMQTFRQAASMLESNNILSYKQSIKH